MSTRILSLEQSTRVNMLNLAVRGFRDTRGVSHQTNVCLVAAMSSVDPAFIETMLRQIPEQDVDHREWIALAMRIDHDVMLDVMAKHFGVVPTITDVRSEFNGANQEAVYETFEEVVVRHDAVRIFNLALREGWTTLDHRFKTRAYDFGKGWTQIDHDWLTHALSHQSERLAESIINGWMVRGETASIQEGLRFLSLWFHRDDEGLHQWWAKLLEAGADPWRLDQNGWDHKNSIADVNGPTPGHRLMLHGLDKMLERRMFRTDQTIAWSSSTRSLWMTMNWSQAPIVSDQSLVWYIINHESLKEMLRKSSDEVLNLLDDFQQQGLSLTQGGMAKKPLGLLLRNIMLTPLPREENDDHDRAFVAFIDRLSDQEKAGDHLASLDITWALDWFQHVLQTIDLTNISQHVSTSISNKNRINHENTKVHTRRVQTLAHRLRGLGRFLTDDARAEAMPWVDQWESTCLTWLQGPDDEREALARTHQERFVLTVAAMTIAANESEPSYAKPVARPRI